MPVLPVNGCSAVVGAFVPVPSVIPNITLVLILAGEVPSACVIVLVVSDLLVPVVTLISGAWVTVDSVLTSCDVTI